MIHSNLQRTLSDEHTPTSWRAHPLLSITLTFHVCTRLRVLENLERVPFRFWLEKGLWCPPDTPFKFGNAKVGKIFENKEFFVLTIVNEAEIFSFSHHPHLC